MGGRVALEVLRRAPERIAGIALLDTGVQPLAEGEAGERETTGRHELLQIACERGMAQMAARWVQGMIWGPRLHETALVATVIDMFVRSSARDFRRADSRAAGAPGCQRPAAGHSLPHAGVVRRAGQLGARGRGIARWPRTFPARNSCWCPSAGTCARWNGPKR